MDDSSDGRRTQQARTLWRGPPFVPQLAVERCGGSKMMIFSAATVVVNSSMIWTLEAGARYPGLVDSAYSREAIKVCYQPLAANPCDEFFKAVDLAARRLLQDGAEEEITPLTCEKNASGFVISYRMEMDHLSASEKRVAIEKQLRMDPCDGVTESPE